MEVDKVKPVAFAVQTLAAISIASLTILTGFVNAWPSYTVARFLTNETQLAEPMSTLQHSLFGGLPNLGGMLGTPFCGYALDKFGRKYGSMMFGLPYVICWTIISLSKNVNLVLVAMALGGMGAAGQAISATYICEISQDSIRGGLANIAIAGFFFGLLASYIMGGYLSFYQVVYTHLALSVLYVFLIMMLKESPIFLMQKGKEKEAAESIAFYRRVSVTSKEVANEIEKIKLQLDPCIDQILHANEENEVVEELLKSKNCEDKGSMETPAPVKEISSWTFLMNSESSKRALVAVLTIMVLSIFMGSVVLPVYAEPLMAEVAPNVPANLAAIMLAVDFLFASLACSFLVDRFGRKTLMTYSSLGSAVCTLLLGIQLQWKLAPGLVTVFIIYAFTLVYTVGTNSVPLIMTAEVFLPEVRGLCNSIVCSVMWSMNFVCLVIFNPLAQLVGLGTVFYGFSAVCLAGAIYSQYCLPETKGQTTANIQLLFLKQKKRKSIAV